MFWAPILLFPGWLRCRNHLVALLSTSSWSKMPDLPLEFRRCHRCRGISISGFGGHIVVSGCRSMLQSLSDTSFELYMVINPRFAIGISMPSHIVSEIYFRFRRQFLVVDHYGNRLPLRELTTLHQTRSRLKSKHFSDSRPMYCSTKKTIFWVQHCIRDNTLYRQLQQQ